MMRRFAKLFRFRLRTIFLAQALLALLLGGWVFWMNFAERQRAAVYEIEKMGGNCETLYLMQPRSTWSKYFFHVQEAHLPRTVSEADFDRLRSELPFTRIFRNVSPEGSWRGTEVVYAPLSPRLRMQPTEKQILRELGTRYEKLNAEYHAQWRELTKDGKSIADIPQETMRLSLLDQVVDDVVDFAETASTPAAAISALVFLFGQETAYHLPDSVAKQARRRAVRLIRDRYLSDPDLLLIFSNHNYTFHDPSMEELLRAAIDESPHEEVRAAACFHLARLLFVKAQLPDFVERIRKVIERGKNTWLLPSLVTIHETYAEGVDVAATRAEAEALLERIIKEYPKQTDPYVHMEGPAYILTWRFQGRIQRSPEPRELGKRASHMLYRVRNIGVGKISPEIVGEDAYGSTFRLSDYRGNVVVLFFNRNSKAFHPDVRSLVKKYQGRPVSILGVSGDYKSDTLRQSIKNQAITWRCWWDGNAGPIAVKWQPKSGLSFHVIDQKGVIRSVNVELVEELEETIDSLLAEVHD